MHPHTRRILAFMLAGVLMMVALFGLLSRGPDFEARFERRVESPLPIQELQAELQNTSDWPQWHFNTIRSELISEGPRRVRLFLEPPKKEWKRFELELAVLPTPTGTLTVRLEHESKGRLNRLFSAISWTIELLPQPEGQGTLIRGTLRATTSGPKGRVFARLAERLVLNQLFYPDLEALANPQKRKVKTGESKDGRLLPF